MRKIRLTAWVVLVGIAALACGCSSDTSLGGSGNSDSGNDSGNDSGSGSGSGISGSHKWLVEAPITQDGCGVRIDPVTQVLTVTENGSNPEVKTGIVKILGTSTSDGFVAEYADEFNGCIRTYTIEFSGLTDTSASAALSRESNCGGSVCVNKWSGTATRQD